MGGGGAVSFSTEEGVTGLYTLRYNRDSYFHLSKLRVTIMNFGTDFVEKKM